MKYILIILLFISCKEHIKIKYVIDGDTVVTTKNEHIRLAGIDAPESKQFYGLQAKQFLIKLMANKTIQLKREGKGRYGRTIGKLYANGLYINKIMVDSGEAWAYKKYSSLYHNELIAKDHHLGLWEYNNPEPPFEFRKEHKH